MNHENTPTYPMNTESASSSLGQQLYERTPHLQHPIPWEDQSPEIRTAYNNAALTMFGELQKKADHYKTQMHSWMQQSLDNGKAIEAHKAMLEEIGMLLGPDAYLTEEGEYQDHVIVSRVPDLAKHMISFVMRSTLALHQIARSINQPSGSFLVEQIAAAAIGLMNRQESQIAEYKDKYQEAREYLVQLASAQVRISELERQVKQQEP